MPYIKQLDRDRIDNFTRTRSVIDTPGELNYAITRLILNYLEDQIQIPPKGQLKYQDINDVLGALEGAKLEFYRRFCAPYEDGKKDQNGDVY